jgi:hypothetical protein
LERGDRGFVVYITDGGEEVRGEIKTIREKK